jgi:hypothetical protein
MFYIEKIEQSDTLTLITFFKKLNRFKLTINIESPKNDNRVQGILKNGKDKTVRKRNDASRSSGF